MAGNVMHKVFADDAKELRQVRSSLMFHKSSTSGTVAIEIDQAISEIDALLTQIDDVERLNQATITELAQYEAHASALRTRAAMLIPTHL